MAHQANNSPLRHLSPAHRAAVTKLTSAQLQAMIANIEAQVKALKTYAKQRHTDCIIDSAIWRMN